LSPIIFGDFAFRSGIEIKEIEGNKKYFKPLTPYFKITFHEEQMEIQTDLVVVE
jgi:hypothetical protein